MTENFKIGSGDRKIFKNQKDSYQDILNQPVSQVNVPSQQSQINNYRLN